MNVITPNRTRELLAKAGAIVEGHFVGTSGKHLSVYVAKDRGTRLTSIASELCEGLARLFAGDDIDVVVAPAAGGIALSQWTAHHLTRLRPDRPEVVALYSEHEEQVIAIADGTREIRIPLPSDIFDRENDIDEITLREGEKLVVKKTDFTLNRGFGIDVKGRRVVTIEDILTTGGSAASTARAVEACGGTLVGIGALVNGGNITAADLSVDRLETLMSVKREIYTREECADHGLCKRGVLINQEFGHGKAFLASLGKV